MSRLMRGGVWVLFAGFVCWPMQGTWAESLEPMVKPTLHVGAVQTIRNLKGREFTFTLVAIDENTVTWQNEAGCTLTRPHEQMTQWTKSRNCGNNYQTKLELKGEIWPLTVGGKWSYKYSGADSRGNVWRGSMHCRVKGQERVEVQLGAFDTYHVTCKTTNFLREWWMSPELGVAVRYKFYDSRRGRRRGWDLVSWDQGVTQ